MNAVSNVSTSQFLQTDASTPQNVQSNVVGKPLGIFLSAFQLQTAPTNGYVLTSDGAGNGSWALNTGVSQTTTGTANATGPVVSSSVTIALNKVGSIVTAHVPALAANGNSSATVITVTTIVPAAYRPTATSQSSQVVLEDNGTFLPGYATVASTGTITYQRTNGGTYSSNAGAANNGWAEHTLLWQTAI